MKTNALRSFIIGLACLTIAGILVAATQNASSQLLSFSTMFVCAALAFVIQWLVFIPSYFKQTERFYDITGSATFVVVVGVALYSVRQPSAYQWLLGAMVIIWALRLGAFLCVRIHNDGKDDRFDDIKQDKYRFWVTWTVQGLWILITSGAAVIAIISVNQTPMTWFTWLGCSFWAIGLIVETTADVQKRQFKRQANKLLPFISTGLWAYSRHPNYVGEILLWIGVAMAAFPLLVGWQLLALGSPLFVTLLLTKVSGLPLLEEKADKKWNDLHSYQEYKKRTPVLLPRIF